ncbi:hypothetical protein, partial [Hyphomonas sp.]|uniref:hypothetical protein n=1 Tax=Hyphomonas sp. TaxID=87 RepID=UPI0035640507
RGLCQRKRTLGLLSELSYSQGILELQMQLFFSLQMQAKRREVEAALHSFDSTIKWHCSKKIRRAHAPAFARRRLQERLRATHFLERNWPAKGMQPSCHACAVQALTI